MKNSYENLKKAFIEAVMEDVNKDLILSENSIKDISFKKMVDIVKKRAKLINVDEIVNFIDNEENIVEESFPFKMDLDYLNKHPIKFTVIVTILFYLLAAGILFNVLLFKNLLTDNSVQQIVTKVENSTNDKKVEVLKSESKSLADIIANKIRDNTVQKATKNMFK